MDSGPVIIKIPTAKVKLSPYGFFRYGADFLKAGDAFKTEGEKFSPVPYYLYSRSIELFLKAFLLANDVSKEKLKDKYRHNLEKILKGAKSFNIIGVVEITPEEEKEIAKANAYYASKGFEYFELKTAMKGYPNLPDLDILKELSSKLQENLKIFVLMLEHGDKET